jgi:PilZ domain-containing protein
LAKDARHQQRVPYAGPIRIGWSDSSGETKYTQGKCVDISEGGLRIEVPVAIPAGTRLILNADRIKVSGSASVKAVTRRGGRFILGLELSQKLSALAFLEN